MRGGQNVSGTALRSARQVARLFVLSGLFFVRLQHWIKIGSKKPAGLLRVILNF
jgi:hypothetical protein